MQIVNRRDAIKTLSFFAAGVAVDLPGMLGGQRKDFHLSFTTLGCPDWSLPRIVDFATGNGYDGIELRGLLREMNLPKAAEFNSGNIHATLRMMEDRNLQFVGLGTSAHLHDADPEKRKSNLDEAKQFIDLAYRIGCPRIRVFPDIIPEGQDRNKTLDLIIDGLLHLADYAKGSKVDVLLEPNGDFAKSDDLDFIMKTVGNPGVGILWNVSFMWLTSRESPKIVYERLKPYIRHTHLKDLKLINGVAGGTASYDVLLGQGNVPVAQAIKCLHNGNYTGSYCCEWEKYWYPQIREPEIALAYFSKQIMRYLR